MFGKAELPKSVLKTTLKDKYGVSHAEFMAAMGGAGWLLQNMFFGTSGSDGLRKSTARLCD
jgi:hypothetical protein